MKKGNIVTIYEDPITKTKIEGRARLLKKLSSNDPQVEYWKVIFNDNDIVNRFILISS